MALSQRRVWAMQAFLQAVPNAAPFIADLVAAAQDWPMADKFAIGDRVFHQKFGNGNVTAIDGNKLTIQFDKAGEKRVVDSFVERV